MLLLTIFAQAQVIEVTGFYGYQFNGKLRTYYGDFKTKDSPNYGGSLGVEVRGNTFLEFSYDRNDSEFVYTRNGIKETQPTLMASEFYMLGTVQQFGIDDHLKPFAGVTAGMVRFHAKESVDIDGSGQVNLSDSYKFGLTIQAGLKYFFSDKLGVRLQGRLLLPMDVNGLFISGGSGGTSGGVSFNIPMVAGNFSAGLVLRLNN